MTIIVQGFDDRNWNGFLTAEQAKLWKLIGIKVSQGRSWNPRDRAVLQRQWTRANRVYGLLRIPFHYSLSPPIGTDPEWYGEAQALNFRNSMKTWNNPEKYGWGELPPCIDVENRFVGMAGPVSRAKCLQINLEKTEELWGRVPLIYTATWYWDTYMHKEFVKLVPKYWEKYDLWEADPAPDTKIAGWGDENSVQQYKLDVPYPGYQSGGLDLDETTQAWINRRLEVPVPPPPSDCSEEIEKAIVPYEAKIASQNEHIDNQDELIVIYETKLNEIRDITDIVA